MKENNKESWWPMIIALALIYGLPTLFHILSQAREILITRGWPQPCMDCRP